MPDPEGERLTIWISDLARWLRGHGSKPGLSEVLSAHAALNAIDASSGLEIRGALRASLCSSRDDVNLLGQALAERGSAVQGPMVEIEQALVSSEDPEETDGEFEVSARAAWSPAERLRDKDFASYTDDEARAAARIIERLAYRRPTRLSRRKRGTRRRSAHLDRRRTLRSSVRSGGEPSELYWRHRRRRSRPVVFVLDISGSMQSYARMLLQYIHAVVRVRSDNEVFVFGTRLTRLTRELRTGAPDEALGAAADSISDWAGGTRIGAALAELNRGQARFLHRSAIVVLLSDGWDRGPSEVLHDEMSRLRRCTHSIIWLNPLKADPAYEPLTLGMQAAMPYVDRLLPGNSIRSLAEVADLLAESADMG